MPPEDCDGVELGESTCKTLGFATGTLACDDTCRFDTSGCSSCGNGVLDDGEECDGAELDGESCASLNHTAGDLGCTADCEFDESACTDCGDGTVEGDEQCDGDDLQGQTCLGMGFLGGGDLQCSDTTCVFQTTDCVGAECGDGTITTPEVCDCGESSSPCTPAELDSRTCTDFEVPGGGSSYVGGVLGCFSPNNCTQFDVAGCYYCGDGTTDPQEDCDGNSVVCSAVDPNYYPSQDAACTAGCEWDESGCEFCGDGTTQTGSGEACDSNSVGCNVVDPRFYPNKSAFCESDCDWNVSNCEFCGDGTAQAASGEACDDGNTNDNDACKNDCTWTCTQDGDCSDGNSCTVDRCISHECNFDLEVDEDGDGYTTCPGPMEDCCDGDDRVHPGQTSYFSVMNECDDFDYDCQGGDNRRFPTLSVCELVEPAVPAQGEPAVCIGNGGWRTTTVPACGDSGSYTTNCQAQWLTNNCGGANTKTETQTCR